jgi:hypothetical protein
LPENPPQTVQWHFDEPQPEWKAGLPHLDWPNTRVERSADALRVTLPEGRRDPNGNLHGSVYVDLPDWRPGEWSQVRVRARTSGSIRSMLLGLNPREQPVPVNATQATFQLNGGITPIMSDGSVQTYLIPPNWGSVGAEAGPWRRVGLGFFAPEPGSIDILSVSIVPTAALYAEDRMGLSGKDPRTGELQGHIEMIDGRWGASLWIGPPEDPLHHRPTPLLLFDVWNDPLALEPVNDEHPDLVAKYTQLLEEQWEAQRLLARRFTPGGQMELTPAQLETLRALGYIR